MATRVAFKTLGVLLVAATHVHAGARPSKADVDRVFARWKGTTSPGCAVGVSQGGKTVLERAYGMADLEHGVPNTPATIFEAGSVSKQFTATAAVLLVQRGLLSLDDPVRKYLPELPDYGTPITFRQMLHHLSGLRDWGFVTFAGGWPRGTRAHTQEHVLDVVSRQKALNYAPGTEYLYSNTGYNLTAVAVARVSGQSFADFTRRWIFEPLGMARTSWRDDYKRIVPGRAVAYARGPGGYRQEMPFENAHGNGGLLTTVGDLLKWNENLGAPRVGGADLVRQLETPGRLEDGREIRYGLGLGLGGLRGVREVAHSGSTAGYRAFLARYPERRLSVAVLCNAGEAPAGDLARAVATSFMGDALEPPPTPVALAPSARDTFAGLFRDERSAEPLRLVVAESKLRIEGGDELLPLSASEFQIAKGQGRIAFEGPDAFRWLFPEGDAREFRRIAQAAPAASELREYAGDYVSDEAEVTYHIVATERGLLLRVRPATEQALSPAYRDAFTGPGGFFLFRRDAQGLIVELSLGLDRVRDLRFRRLSASPPDGAGRLRPSSGT